VFDHDDGGAMNFRYALSILLVMAVTSPGLAEDTATTSDTAVDELQLDGKSETELKEYVRLAREEKRYLEGIKAQLTKEVQAGTVARDAADTAYDEKNQSAVSSKARVELLSSILDELKAITSPDVDVDNARARNTAQHTLAIEQQVVADRELALAHKTREEARGEYQSRVAALAENEKLIAKKQALIESVSARLAKQRLTKTKLTRELSASRYIRCQVALCWGDQGTEWAVEPVLDLPIGIVWSAGSGALTSYINANKLNIEFNAGLRFWMWHDRFSIMLYFAAPVVRGDDKIRLEGSGFEHPTSSIQRPFPSVGIGFFGDILQFGFAYDLLINGDGDQDRDPRYRPNQVLSRSLTITLGFATVLTARTALAHTGSDKDKQ
jgi:hypothetical protein